MHVPLDEDDRRRGESDGDRFFHGLTENVFYGLMGIADPPLVEYISSLLVRFIRNDIFYELPGAPGVAVADLTDMLTDAQKRSGAQARKEYRHIGDYTLFWTGVYPEALQSFKDRFARIIYSIIVSPEKERISLPAAFALMHWTERANCFSDSAMSMNRAWRGWDKCDERGKEVQGMGCLDVSRTVFCTRCKNCFHHVSLEFG